MIEQVVQDVRRQLEEMAARKASGKIEVNVKDGAATFRARLARGEKKRQRV